MANRDQSKSGHNRQNNIAPSEANDIDNVVLPTIGKKGFAEKLRRESSHLPSNSHADSFSSKKTTPADVRLTFRRAGRDFKALLDSFADADKKSKS